jgi:hypothetical protein
MLVRSCYFIETHDFTLQVLEHEPVLLRRFASLYYSSSQKHVWNTVESERVCV